MSSIHLKRRLQKEFFKRESKVNDQFLQALHSIYKITNEDIIDRTSSEWLKFDLPKYQNKIKDDPNYSKMGWYINQMAMDQILPETIFLAKDIESRSVKNFVVSKNLSKALSEVGTRVKIGSFLEMSSPYYIEMDGLEVNGSSLRFAYIDTPYLCDDKVMIRFFIYYIDENKETSTIMKQFEASEDVSIEEIVKVEYYNEVDKFLIQSIFASCIYILGNNEELKEKVNTFAGSKKAIETQKNSFSTEAFHLMGEDFKYLRLLKGDKFSVKGHFRWQRCGKDLKDIKLTFVTPHERALNSNILK
jgi:hypothetical protein